MEEEKDEAPRTRLCLLLSLLPEDLIINNILLKLPVRSVMRLRCVCKYFWSLTTTPTFVNLHLDHAKTDLLINNHPPLILISYLEKYCSLRPQVIFDYNATIKQLSLINTTTTTNCCLSSSAAAGDDNTNTVVVEDVKNIPCDHWSSGPFDHFRIWGSCNGLLCVVGARRYGGQHNCLPCIWNPCTKEFKRLPPPPKELDMINTRDGFMAILNHGFGYDRTMDDYKVIIWIHWNSLRPDVPSESVINVYALGGGGGGATNSPSWRCAPYKPFGGIQRLQRTGLYFRGALHWVIEVVDHHLDRGLEVVEHHHLEEAGPYRKQIVSFDIEAEAFRELVPRPPVVLVPNGCSEGDQEWVLEELRGCLCLLICSTHEKRIIDVWMMKDYGLLLVNNGCCCWTNLLTIVAELPTPAPGPRSFIFNPQTASIPLRLCENGEILILEDEKGLYMYDPKRERTRSIIETEDIRKGINFLCIETYIESLVSLKTVFL